MQLVVKTYEPTYNGWGLFAGIRACYEIWQVKLEFINEQSLIVNQNIQTRICVDRII